MKPKTTLNLLKDFFSDIIQKTFLFLLPFFEKRTWSDTLKISNLLSIVSYSSVTFADTVFKITTIKTDKSENIKSAPPEEMYYYTLQIANY